MRRNRVTPLVALALTLAYLPRPGLAQYDAQALQQALAAVDCGQLATMPNAPISVEACEAQKAAYGKLGAALAAPGESRPGDAAMGCEEIIAELQASDFTGVSAKTAAEAEAAGGQLQAAVDTQQSRAAAMAAQQGLETAAASTAPNAVQGAVALEHEAEQAALRQSAKAQIRPAQTRAGQASANAAQELAESLDTRPRVATLMQLAAARGCEVP